MSAPATWISVRAWRPRSTSSGRSKNVGSLAGGTSAHRPFLSHRGGWGPVVEVRSKLPLNGLSTVSLADEVGSLVELDFESGTGIFAGLRLQAYHDVGQQQSPFDLLDFTGLPVLRAPSMSTRVAIPRLVCSKHMTAIDRGDLLLNWSESLNFDLTSIQQLKSSNGFVQGCLRAYYRHGELVAFRLEDVPITIFNELPHFAAPGR